MSQTAILLISLAILAHLVADFVFQTNAIAEAKAAPDRRGWRGLATHTAIVALCLVPFVLAFGGRGLAYLVVVSLAHGLIDRTKVVLNWRAARSPAPADPPDGELQGVPDVPGDQAWTPLPAVLFLADQAAHLVVLVLGASVMLLGQPLLQGWRDAVHALAGHLLPVSHPQAALIVIVVLIDLAIFNIRGGLFMVGTLLTPRGFSEGAEPGPERVGATIGVLERLIVCALVLTGQIAAIGLVIAAKTLARFRQLDDRRFAEYYLVGTLASVTLALTTSVVAAAALASLR
jgi:Protein of unknown function (DUF3307)